MSETKGRAKGLYYRLLDAILKWTNTGDSKALTRVLKELERFYEEIQDEAAQKQVSHTLTKGEPYDFWDIDIAKGLLHGIWAGPTWKDEFLRLPQNEEDFKSFSQKRGVREA